MADIETTANKMYDACGRLPLPVELYELLRQRIIGDCYDHLAYSNPALYHHTHRHRTREGTNMMIALINDAQLVYPGLPLPSVHTNYQFIFELLPTCLETMYRDPDLPSIVTGPRTAARSLLLADVVTRTSGESMRQAINDFYFNVEASVYAGYLWQQMPKRLSMMVLYPYYTFGATLDPDDDYHRQHILAELHWNGNVQALPLTAMSCVDVLCFNWENYVQLVRFCRKITFAIINQLLRNNESIDNSLRYLNENPFSTVLREPIFFSEFKNIRHKFLEFADYVITTGRVPSREDGNE